MERRERNAFVISAVAHAIVAVGVLAYLRTHPVTIRFDAPVRTIEFDLVAAPLASSASPGDEGPHAEGNWTNTTAATPPPAGDSHVASINGPSRAAHVGPSGYEIGSRPAIAPEPNPPAGSAPDPFLGWRPRAADGTPQSTGALRGTDLLARADDDSTRAGLATGLENMPSRGTTETGAGGGSGAGQGAGSGGNAGSGVAGSASSSGGGANAGRIADASSGYVRRLLDDAAPTQIPGSVPYFTRIAREATRVFRPVSVPTPTLGDALVGTFFAPTDVAMDVTRRSLGPLAEGRAGRALEELQYTHPNSDLLQPRNTMSARAAAMARTTTVQIEIDQDSTGRIIATRVLRRSGVSGYDRTAMEAIQQAVRGLDPPPIQGIWRSRWAFDVTTSRDPLISTLPGTPGAPPTFGVTAEFEFDEVTGETEMHLPGRVHTRRRVRLVASHVVAPGEVPRGASNRDGAAPAH